MPKLSACAEGPILFTKGMKLGNLLGDAGEVETRHKNSEVTRIVYNSQEAVPGSLFVAIRGETTNGNRFVLDALTRGAGVVVSEMSAPPGPEWNSILGEAVS